MKKTSLMLLSVLALGLVACGGGDNVNNAMANANKAMANAANQMQSAANTMANQMQSAANQVNNTRCRSSFS